MPTEKRALTAQQKRILGGIGAALVLVAVVAALGHLGKEPEGELERVGRELKQAVDQVKPAPSR